MRRPIVDLQKRWTEKWIQAKWHTKAFPQWSWLGSPQTIYLAAFEADIDNLDIRRCWQGRKMQYVQRIWRSKSYALHESMYQEKRCMHPRTGSIISIGASKKESIPPASVSTVNSVTMGRRDVFSVPSNSILCFFVVLFISEGLTGGKATFEDLHHIICLFGRRPQISSWTRTAPRNALKGTIRNAKNDIGNAKTHRWKARSKSWNWLYEHVVITLGTAG